MRYSLLFLALSWPLAACQTASPAAPQPREREPAPRSNVSVAQPAAVSVTPQLPIVRGSARERCPDELLPRGAEGDLAVRVEDVRAERR